MPRSPLALAALATVAIPGLDAYDVRRAGPQGAGVDSTVVVDAQGRRWMVRAPHDSAAGAALEAEVALLDALTGHVDAGRLPFDVPRPAGFAHLPEGGRAVVHPQLPGRPLRLELLGPGPGLAAALGRAIAALHELPTSTVEDAGLPVYDAEAYRKRRLSEVDEAARTGHVPTILLQRWERALEDVAVWRFQPTVVHGDLSADHVLCTGDEPTAVLGWSEAKVADPADDLAWLLVAAPQEAVDPILEAYSLRRTELSDHHLSERALLAGELALARWLLYGVRTRDPAVIDDARGMLSELEQHATAEQAAQQAAASAQRAAAEEKAARAAAAETDLGPSPEPVPAVEGAADLDADADGDDAAGHVVESDHADDAAGAVDDAPVDDAPVDDDADEGQLDGRPGTASPASSPTPPSS